MMYGFGDEQIPRLDSIKLMEEMVIEYIIGLVAKVWGLVSIIVAHPSTFMCTVLWGRVHYTSLGWNICLLVNWDDSWKV